MAQYLDLDGLKAYHGKLLERVTTPIQTELTKHGGAIATYGGLGHIKPWKSYTAASKWSDGTTTAETSAAVTLVNKPSNIAGRYYAVEMDNAGRAFVNVPWITKPSESYQADKVKNPLSLYVNSTNPWNYNGSAAVNLKFADGTNTNVVYDSSVGAIKINAKDTIYTHPAVNHIPAGGVAGQMLAFESTGTAKWYTPSKFTIAFDGGTTENTDKYTYDPFNAKSINIKQGSNVTLTKSAGVITINAKDTIYTHPITTGHRHIPSGGKTDDFLQWSADGTAVWSPVEWGEVAGKPETATRWPSFNEVTNKPLATYNTAGIIKSYKSYTGKTTGAASVAGGAVAPEVNAITTNAGRYYAIETDSEGKAFVNVPWVDTNTVYTHPATHPWSMIAGVPFAGVAAGVAKTFKTYTTDIATPSHVAGGTAPGVNSLSSNVGRYYGVESDKSGRLFVNIPWTDTVYTHPHDKHIPAGGSANQILGWSSLGTATWMDAAPLASKVANAFEVRVNGGGICSFNGEKPEYVNFIPGSNKLITISASDKNITIGQNEDAHDGRYYTKGQVDAAIDSKIAAADAMIYKGTIGASVPPATVSALPANSKIGWTYKVITRGTYAGHVCEVGDMLISLKNGASPTTNADWSCIQTNMDGIVTGPASATDSNIPLFNGATGKVIKNSTYNANHLIKSVAGSGTNSISIKSHGSATYDFTINNVSNATSAGTANQVKQSLTIKGNGTPVAEYNGFTAKTVDIKPKSASSNITVESDSSGNIMLSVPNMRYTHPSGPGNNHIPAGGAAGQFLQWSSNGTAAWSPVEWSEVTGKPDTATRWPSLHEVTAPALGFTQAGDMHFSFLPFIETAGTNMFAMARANDEIKVERSTNNGASWVDVTSTEAPHVKAVFSGVINGSIPVSARGGKGVVGHQLRITFSPKSRYSQLMFMYIWASTDGGTCLMDVENNTADNKTVWKKIITDKHVSGWSGPNVYGLGGIMFDGYGSASYGLRMTFKQTATSTEYNGNVQLMQIRAYSKQQAWSTPANNPLAQSNTPYEIKDADLTTNFPGTLQCKGNEVWHKGNLTLNSLGGTASRVLAVADYGNTSSDIKIGWTGADVQPGKIKSFAVYTDGAGGNNIANIKDATKESVQAYLGISSFVGKKPDELSVNHAVKADSAIKADSAGTAGTANQVAHSLKIQVEGTQNNIFNGFTERVVNFTDDGESGSIIVSQSGQNTTTSVVKYSHNTDPGHKHIPAGGSTGQFLQWSSNGAAVWSPVEWNEVTGKPLANTTTPGIVKTFKTGALPTVEAITTTSGRYYGVESDTTGKLFVNVPWKDTDTGTTDSAIPISVIDTVFQ